MRKIFWVSDLVVPTGFGRVSHSILENIWDDYEITGLGINYFGDPHPYDKLKIYSAAIGGNSPFGERRLVDLVRREKYDLIYILQDVWVIARYLKALKEISKEIKLPKIVVYFPVDADFHDPSWYEDFDLVSKAVVYTRFAREVVKKAVPHLEVDIIPHGVDHKKFYPIFSSREEAKKVLFKGFEDRITPPEESFIVLNANRNQPRKRLDITMEGFAKFAKDKPPGVKLYMHCGVVDASMDIVKLAARFEISERLIISSVTRGIMSVPDERLNLIYNACDVGINTSVGEGWGLTNVEHAMTGAAQIVPNHSACRELFWDCGYLIPVSLPYTLDHTMTVGGLVSSDSVAAVLEAAYSNPSQRERLAFRALNKFGNPEYTWENISARWKAVFEEVLNAPPLAE
jgi:D-inositol-3-phosphate glycosyltransferase